MKIVALSGGIGSGKSTATQFFTEWNVPIIDTDILAREIVALHSPILSRLAEHFGSSILQKDGSLDRKALRNIIFENNEAKKWVEALLHPAIDALMQQKIAEITADYCVVVIPLLAENIERYRSLVDHILIIDVPYTQQLTQVTLRDQLHSAFIQKIIASQASRAERLRIADTVISNTGTLEEFKNMLYNFHKDMLSNCSKK